MAVYNPDTTEVFVHEVPEFPEGHISELGRADLIHAVQTGAPKEEIARAKQKVAQGNPVVVAQLTHAVNEAVALSQHPLR